MSKMRQFHFDIGDICGEGSIGICAVIVSTSKEKAVVRLYEMIGKWCIKVPKELTTDEYLQLFVGDIRDSRTREETWPQGESMDYLHPEHKEWFESLED